MTDNFRAGQPIQQPRRLIPEKYSKAAGWLQVHEGTWKGEAGWIVEYGGSMGSEFYKTEEQARTFTALWADERAKKLEKEAEALRLAAARLRFSQKGS